MLVQSIGQGLRRRNARMTFGVVAIALLSLSTASLLWGKNPISPGHEVEAGGTIFTLPPDFAPEYARTDGDVGSRVYGTMDERKLCFYSYFAVIWSGHELSDSALLPAPAYKVTARSSSPVTLHNGSRAVLVALSLSARKPCGRVITEDLCIIKFYRKQSKTYYAIAGFIKPMLSLDRLEAVASGGKSGETAGAR
jgi:hypothetical protein